MKKLLLTLLTLLIAVIKTPLSALSELHIALEEQTPEAIQKKCSTEPNIPILTPNGVINPFKECLRGNSEMKAYVPHTTSSDSENRDEKANTTIALESMINENNIGEFNSNASDPDDFPDIAEDDMKAFLKMVQDAQEQKLD